MNTLKTVGARSSASKGPRSFNVTPSAAQARVLRSVADRVGVSVEELILGLSMGLIEAASEDFATYPAELVEQFAFRRDVPSTAPLWTNGRFVPAERRRKSRAA